MNKKVFLFIAAIIMALVGALRGIGGTLLFIHGNQLAVEPPVTSSDIAARICGLELIIVMLLFFYSAYALLKHRSYFGWKLSWIGIALFLVGGIVNGYLMFGNPFVQDQIINFSASILIALFLILGKKALKG